MRPVLTPAARRLWRDPETLQLGRGAGRTAVLSGVDPSTRAALSLLDGTRDAQQVRASAGRLGCSPGRTDELLDLLATAGLLEDAGAVRDGLDGLDRRERERLAGDVGSLALLRGDGGLPAVALRRRARIQVRGAGRVGAVVAALLAAAGIGAVDVVDDQPTREQDAGIGGLTLADVGRTRGEATRRLLQATGPSVHVGALRHPDLVVLAPVRPADLDPSLAALDPATPHLLAEVRDTVGVVGPLVLPGRGPCLHCLDLTRCDLDPAWPALAAQLATPSRTRQACDGPLALLVAGQASLQVLALVDATATPATLGGTLEMALPDWRWRRRSWPAHPDCPCGAA